MITVAKELLSDVLEEVKEIIHTHYEELALDKDYVPLSPQYDVYLKREELGELVFYSARKNGQMIGYFIGFVSPGLHYSTCLTCIMDIFYVHPSHRGDSTGLRLLKFVEKSLIDRGVERWFCGTKVHMDIGPIFERVGMRRVEVTYSKYLGGDTW